MAKKATVVREQQAMPATATSTFLKWPPYANYFRPLGQWHIMNIRLTSCRNAVGGEISLSAGRRRSTVNRRHPKYGRMQAAYARVQLACMQQQPAYDRNASCMQVSCSLHTVVYTTVCIRPYASCMHTACSLHYSVVWPRLNK